MVNKKILMSKTKHKPQVVTLKDLVGKTYNATIEIKDGKATLTNIKQVDPKKERIIIPEKGQVKFFVTCERLTLYTTIGADNTHHASNKATKLFGPHWSKVTTEPFHCQGYEFCTVAIFTQLLKTLPN
jgi:hypothetical protein